MTDWPAFIEANTKLVAPPLVPEIVLHLAEESLPIWRRTEEELAEVNVPPPFWAFALAGGQALARYLLDHADVVAGKIVLDLGSGSGLVAIAAARAGAARVLAADVDAVALHAIAANAAANQVFIQVSGSDLLVGHPPAMDVLLIGDLFYEKPLAQAVLAFADEAAARGALVLAGDPVRSYFPKARFTARAHYGVPVTRELEDMEIKNTAVWALETPAEN